MCVSVRESAIENKSECERVCVRDRVSVIVSVRDRVSMRERERDRERECVCKSGLRPKGGS